MPRPELYPVKKVIGFNNTMLEAVEKWRAKQKPIPTVSDAIRRLVEIGIGSTKIARRAMKDGAPTARDLAAVQIDRLVDSSAHPEEQATRKRRLLKGPEEFRDVRVDRKAKK